MKITNLPNRCATPTSPFGLLMVFAFLFLNTLTFAQGDGQYTLGPTTLGTTAHTNVNTNGVTPFMVTRRDSRNQYLYLASELTSQSAGAGNITHLAFYVTAAPTGVQDKTMKNVNISIGSTTATTVPATTTILPTTVALTIPSLTITTGWNTFDLTTNGAFPNGFVWNGTDNIVVEICQSGTKATYPTTNYTVQTSTFPVATYMNNGFYGSSNANTATPGCTMYTGVPTGNTTAATNANRIIRPDVQFTFRCEGAPPQGLTKIAGSTLSPAYDAPINYCIGPVSAPNYNDLVVLGATNASRITYQWQSSTNGSSFSNISGATAATYSAIKADVDTWYLRNDYCATSGVTTASQAILIGADVWNGAGWTFEAAPSTEPDITHSAVFAGNFNSATNSSTVDLEFCSVVVKSGTVTIKTGNSLLVQDQITRTGGTLVFEDSASLTQNNTSSSINSGDVSFMRNTTPVRRYDYTYWSSPVANQSLYNLSPLTLGDKFYSYSGTAWIQENSANIMGTAKGYIVRAPQTYAINLSATYTATFSGVPNNGNISINVPAGASNMYLIGNPYPSGLNALSFLTANSSILGGTIYLWTHNTLPNNDYHASDYAAYNKTGGVLTYPSSSPSQPGGADNFAVPNGEIASGQGFMAEPSAAAPGGNIQFTNSMRYTASSKNDQFFKTAGSTVATDAQEEEIENNRLWLNLTNEDGAFKQILVGYVTGATMDYESAFDGNNMSNSAVNLFSIIDNHQLVIQGRALPFENADVVPLGFTATTAGNHTIGLAYFDGLFDDQDIYLEDTYLNVIYNLKSGNYVFATTAGTFLDRFVVRYTESALGVKENALTDNSIIAFNKNGSLVVNSGKVNMQSVKVYDLSGRLVLEKNNCQATNVVFDKANWNAQLMLVQITTEDKVTVSRKVLF